MKITERAGRVVTAVWLLAAVAAVAYGLLNPGFFTQESMVRVMERWGSWAFGGFVAVSLLRGFLLVPSTPVIVAGSILFPTSLASVFFVSIVGIVIAASALYHMPALGGYDALLERRHPQRVGRLKRQLVKPRAFWFVVAWSAFPLVPTDVICYAAGLVQMSYRRMIFAMLLGEVPLVIGLLVLSERVQNLMG